MRYHFVFLIIGAFISCNSEKSTFKLVSSFGNDTIQYYTFNISERVDLSGGMTDQVKAEIKEHGTLQARKEVVTATFYFRGNAPNIENAIGGLDASTKIQESKPVAVLWAMPDGRVQLIENPG